MKNKFYHLPIYDEKDNLITVLYGTYEILDSIASTYTAAAEFMESPNEIALMYRVAREIVKFLNELD